MGSSRTERLQSPLGGHFGPRGVKVFLEKSPSFTRKVKLESHGQASGLVRCILRGWPSAARVPFPAGRRSCGLGENAGCAVRGGPGTRARRVARPRKGTRRSSGARPAACSACRRQPLLRPPLFQVQRERCPPAPAPWTSSSSLSRTTCSRTWWCRRTCTPRSSRSASAATAPGPR